MTTLEILRQVLSTYQSLSQLVVTLINTDATKSEEIAELKNQAESYLAQIQLWTEADSEASSIATNLKTDMENLIASATSAMPS